MPARRQLSVVEELTKPHSVSFPFTALKTYANAKGRWACLRRRRGRRGRQLPAWLPAQAASGDLLLSYISQGCLKPSKRRLDFMISLLCFACGQGQGRQTFRRSSRPTVAYFWGAKQMCHQWVEASCGPARALSPSMQWWFQAVKEPTTFGIPAQSQSSCVSVCVCVWRNSSPCMSVHLPVCLFVCFTVCQRV